MTALECENARSARSHIYSINVSVLSIYCRLERHTTSKRKLHWLYMQMNVYTLNIYDFETKYTSIDTILKEMTVSECENAKKI